MNYKKNMDIFLAVTSSLIQWHLVAVSQSKVAVLLAYQFAAAS
jgi:hypothetical protein